MSYDQWLTTDPADRDPYRAGPGQFEDDDPGWDRDDPGDDPDDPGPTEADDPAKGDHRPADHSGGRPASPGDIGRDDADGDERVV